MERELRSHIRFLLQKMLEQRTEHRQLAQLVVDASEQESFMVGSESLILIGDLLLDFYDIVLFNFMAASLMKGLLLLVN